MFSVMQRQVQGVLFHRAEASASLLRGQSHRPCLVPRLDRHPGVRSAR